MLTWTSTLIYSASMWTCGSHSVASVSLIGLE